MNLEPEGRPKTVFKLVGENLYRAEPSGLYYALIKRSGKQFRRSLKTRDRKLAERRLHDLRDHVQNLKPTAEPNLRFADLAERWLGSIQHTLKPTTVSRYRRCIKALEPFLGVVSLRNIAHHHCEAWVTSRGDKIAPQTFAHELNTMRGVFGFAIDRGFLLQDPSRQIRRRRIPQSKILIPSREQFQTLVAIIRASDGRVSSQGKATEGANLVELLAYSGCRLEEALSLRWSHIDFEKRCITVTGGDRGTKNHESRVVPMAEALRTHLERLRKDKTVSPADPLITIKSARKCLETACAKLKFPVFTHHDFRHFFATTCIEAGVDIPTVSRWLGHKDGGALAMKVYGHLRQEHSLEMIKKVQF